ncbi:MAG TPA: YfiR family protein [Noviherbaspirillum sp.]|nr:YfiR family protein [Noviherbaspirillum sp.]
MRSERGATPSSGPRRLAGALAAAWLFAVPAHAGAQPVAEPDLKAAFIYNFTLFTEWPAEAGFEGGALNVCVNPASGLREPLQALTDKPVRGRRMAVRVLTAVDGLRGCDALVLDDADRARGGALIAAARALPVLTIADGPEVAGSIIALAREGDRLVFDVDTAAARRSNLKLSSRLLRLARTVR